MRQRTILIATAAAAILGSTAVQAWHTPYSFPNKIEAAAAASDTDRLERLINYDLVQYSLAKDIVENAPPDTQPFVGRLAPLIATTAFTPKNTIQFYTQDSVDFGQGIALISAKHFDRDSLKRRYVNFSTFEYHINSKPDGNSHNEYTITAKRRGLFDWQVVKVEFVTVDQTIPATSPMNTRTFEREIPDVFMTSDENVSCTFEDNMIACVNKNDEGMICDQTACEYDEAGDARFKRGATFTGSFERSRLSCTVTRTNVQCYVRNSSGEVTSEYVEILGDVAGARGE